MKANGFLDNMQSDVVASISLPEKSMPVDCRYIENIPTIETDEIIPYI